MNNVEEENQGYDKKVHTIKWRRNNYNNSKVLAKVLRGQGGVQKHKRATLTNFTARMRYVDHSQPLAYRHVGNGPHSSWSRRQI